MGATLGQRIIYYRKKACLSRKRLAGLIGISYDVLYRYEKDSREPNVVILMSLAKALNITSDALLGLEPHADLIAQNSDEATLLRTFRNFNGLWRDKVLNLNLWLSEMSRCNNPTEHPSIGAKSKAKTQN